MTPVNTAPVVTATDQTPAKNALIDAASLFSVADADFDTIEKFAFWDDVAGAESGSFVLDGVTQSAQQEVVVDAADLALLQFQAGDLPSGWDYLYVRAFDGTAWSNWTGVGGTRISSCRTLREQFGCVPELLNRAECTSVHKTVSLSCGLTGAS